MVRARERDPVTNGALTGSLFVVRAAARVGLTRLLAQKARVRHDGGIDDAQRGRVIDWSHRRRIIDLVQRNFAVVSGHR